MTDYEKLPVIEMTVDEFTQIEDRSACIGLDRVPGERFRADFSFYSLREPRWVIGTFYVDEEERRKEEEFKELCKRVGCSSPFLYPTYVKIRWERVKFVVGHWWQKIKVPQSDAASQLARIDQLRARL